MTGRSHSELAAVEEDYRRQLALFWLLSAASVILPPVLARTLVHDQPSAVPIVCVLAFLTVAMGGVAVLLSAAIRYVRVAATMAGRAAQQALLQALGIASATALVVPRRVMIARNLLPISILTAAGFVIWAPREWVGGDQERALLIVLALSLLACAALRWSAGRTRADA